MGQGYAIGFPIVAGAVLWQTAEKITRRKPYFRPTLVWSTMPLVIALPLVLMGLWPTGGIKPMERVVVLGVASVFVALALLVRQVCLKLARWRDRRILVGQRGSSAG